MKQPTDEAKRDFEFLELLTGYGAANNKGSFGNRRAKGYARRRKRTKATNGAKNGFPE